MVRVEPRGNRFRRRGFLQEQQRQLQHSEALQRSFNVEKAAMEKRFKTSAEKLVALYR